MPRLKCKRCEKLFRGQLGWNVELRGGVVQFALCGDCQTPEENAEAELNAATLTYAKDELGRVVGTPKGVA